MALKVSNLEGNEIADDYKRSVVPQQGRWSEAWYVFKTNFWKLVIINIFLLISFAPAIGIMIYRTFYLQALGELYPFNSSILYPFYPDVTGLAERLTLTTDLIFYSSLIGAGLIASVGIAGATYSIRRLLNTHNEFSVKSFFHGVKLCYVKTVLPVTVFLLFLFSTILVGDWVDIVSATGGNKGGAITAYVFIIIATVLVGIYCAWVYAVGTNYRIKPSLILKNSFSATVGTILATVVMAGFSLIPVWLFMIGGFIRAISYILFILFGFSFIIFSWAAFTQWAFDTFVPPNIKVQTEKKGAKGQENVAADEKQHARELLAAGRSELIARPIMPIAAEAAVYGLEKNFTRADIAKISADRDKLNSQVSDYENEHKNEAAYVEYNKLFAEREKVLQTDTKGKKGKKKKISSDNLLR